MKLIQIRCKGTSTIPLQSLQNFQGNLKELREPEYKKLRRSIEKYGFRFPIFVWGQFILDGHQRIFILKKMVSEGWSIGPIPVVEIEAENEKEAKRLTLLISSRYGHVTDEGLYEFIMTAELNFDELKEEIDLPEIDFKQFEQSYFTGAPKDAEPQIDRAEELNKKWQVKTGDLWQIGEHRLLCGDSTKAEDVENLITIKEAELLFTSPPYSDMRDYHGETLEINHLIKFIDAFNFSNFIVVNLGIKREGHQIVEYWQDYIKKAKENGYLFLSWNCWNQIFNGSIAKATAMFRIEHEWIFVFGKEFKKLNPTVPNQEAGVLNDHQSDRQKDGTTLHKKAKIIRQYRELGTVLSAYPQLARDITLNHPATFPVEVPSEYIKAMTNEDQVIIDPFLGSGTTMVACQNLNRKCRGIEISPAYCAVILERMATAFPGIEIKRINAK